MFPPYGGLHTAAAVFSLSRHQIFNPHAESNSDPWHLLGAPPQVSFIGLEAGRDTFV